jgi:hypothetical protein
MMEFRTVIKKLFEDNEHVTIFSTYGYRQGTGWKIPIRIWVNEQRRLVEALVKVIADTVGTTSRGELQNFETRIARIAADSESRERVVFRFDSDSEKEEWGVQTDDGRRPKSDLNGIIDGFIKLDNERAVSLLEAQSSQKGWLTIRAISKEHSGLGRIQLIEPKGVSVISDIDDTLKVTEIPAGGKIVVRNTFFGDFIAAPEMINRYKSLGTACFHYVSGAPWQLYEPLSEFVNNEDFPEGSFHMKNVPTNLLSPTTWRDLLKLVGDATVDQKLKQISTIMSRFPERRFILVGDSGEHDPEIFHQLRETFGDQVEEIWIRDVVNARHTTPERLSGMNVIAARTISEGVSEFSRQSK